MNILYVWDADYPWDVRTEKICRALSDHGHRVVIAARNLAGRPRQEVLPEGLVERMPAFPGPLRRSLSFPAFMNPFWATHLRQQVTRHGIDLLMVRDLPLAPTALLVAGRRLPVILDMAENYAAMMADIWRDGRQKALDVVVRNPRIVRSVERRVLSRVDHTITVVEESAERLIAMGTDPSCVSVVSNTPPRGRVTPPPTRDPGEPMRLIYLGLMERHRGIGEVIEAVRHLAARGVPISMDLIGDGRDLDLFRASAEALRLPEGMLRFHGRLSHPDALGLVRQAHVGLVPHHATEAWNTTIPNKLFDYMAAGIAVISSDARPAARVVQATGAGRVFPAGDARSIADCVVDLMAMEPWVACGAAGQAAILREFNWELDTARLLESVSRVTTTSAQRIHSHHPSAA